jgi:hypothetical protein
MPAAGSAGSSAVSRSSTAEGESKTEKKRGGAEVDYCHDRGSESGNSMRKSPDERGVAAAKRQERRTPAVTASYGDA